jgi:RimJ/RimL family protein N-acetyltransferase
MLTLIPFTPEHFPILSGWFQSEKDVVQWGGPRLSYPLGAEQLQAMLDEGRIAPPSRLCWMASDTEDRLVGHVQLGFDWRNGLACVARVAIAPSMRGRGLAIPMLLPVLDQAFAHAEIERVELNVYSWNAPAIRAYLRLGFTHEGTRRSSARVGDERWDTAIMGLLRREWKHPASRAGESHMANLGMNLR